MTKPRHIAWLLCGVFAALLCVAVLVTFMAARSPMWAGLVRRIAALRQPNPAAAQPMVHAVPRFTTRPAVSGAQQNPGSGTTRYVATNGSDTNPGTEQAPFKSLQKAADLVQPGDTVIVRSGTYNQGMNVYGRPGGTAARPIRFLAEPGVIITHCAASGPNATLAAINIENSGGFYVVQGFQIASDGSMQRAGIRVTGSTGTQVLSNTIDKAYIGIFASNSDSLLIQGNTCSNSTDQHGIYVSANTRNGVIRGNILFSNRYDGLHLNASNAAGPNDGALVEGNVIYANRLSGMDVEGATNATFRNNLIYNNGRHGITIHSQDQTAAGVPTPPSANNLFVNNTIVSSNTNLGFAIQIRQSDMKQTLFNNIFVVNGVNNCGAFGIAGDTAGASATATGLVSDYNAVVSLFSTNAGTGVNNRTLAQWQSATAQDTHSVVATAAQLFVNAPGGDFRLKTGSPAIDAGVASLNGKSASADDFDGVARPQGKGHDIGAYELKYVVGSGQRPMTNDTDY